MYFKISLQIYIIFVRNNKTYIFLFFALKTDNSHFCQRDIPTIYNGYCVSNAVDYAKTNDVFTNDFVNWIKGSVIIEFSIEHNLTSINRYFHYLFHFLFLSIWRSAACAYQCVYSQSFSVFKVSALTCSVFTETVHTNTSVLQILL